MMPPGVVSSASSSATDVGRLSDVEDEALGAAGGPRPMPSPEIGLKRIVEEDEDEKEKE